MNPFSIMLLLIISFSVLATETKKDSVNNHDALAKEGITILSEEHIRTPGVSSVPPIKTQIRTLSAKEMNNC